MTRVFLHGLESSSKGYKACWFRERFPAMMIPDFTGPLDVRLARLDTLLAGKDRIVLVGSSFGGLMATVFALENETRVQRIILLAPALNFPELAGFSVRKTAVPARLYIGSRDTICPPDTVIPAARKIFPDLTVHLSDDDHLLRNTFPAIAWETLLAE